MHIKLLRIGVLLTFIRFFNKTDYIILLFKTKIGYLTLKDDITNNNNHALAEGRKADLKDELKHAICTGLYIGQCNKSF